MCLPAFALGDISTGPMLSDEPHIYPIQPGSDEWISLTPQQRRASCQVTQSEVIGMTTAALVKTVVYYPYLVDMYAYDTIEAGITAVSRSFPGLSELLLRDDAVVELQNFLVGRDASQQMDLEQYATIDAELLLAYLTYVPTDDPLEYGPEIEMLETPRHTEVTAFKNLSWSDYVSYCFGSPEYILVERERGYATSYPTAQKMGNITCVYNCASYALHQQSTANNHYIPDPTPYFSDFSYQGTSCAPGVVVTYSSSLYYSDMNHFGIVDSVSGSNVTVVSKWGAGGLYIHAVDDCPYIDDYPIVLYWAVAPY